MILDCFPYNCTDVLFFFHFGFQVDENLLVVSTRLLIAFWFTLYKFADSISIHAVIIAAEVPWITDYINQYFKLKLSWLIADFSKNLRFTKTIPFILNYWLT